jgi:putative restriction endonuclease
VKSGTWNDAMLAGHREYLRDDSTKEAFDVLVREAIDSPNFLVGPAWHGDIREFRYFDAASEEQPFAFIVNRGDLLFYVRAKGLQRVVGGFGALRRRFSSAAENSRGEWTVRIASKEDAERLNELLIAPQSTDSVRSFDQLSEARSMILAVLPDEDVRKAVLEQLLESSDAVERIAPSAWGVTLFSNGFRLNVGQVEVFVLSGDVIRFNLLGRLGEPPFIGPSFVEGQYRSVRAEHCAFVGTPAEFAERRAVLQRAHLDFVRQAATKQSGEPIAGSPHRGSHSEGLLAYAREEVGAAPALTGIPDGITRDDVLGAIRRLDEGVEHGFGPSLKYDLVFEGRRYPPKAVLGLAAERVAERVLSPSDFSGGQDSKSTRILEELGFLVESKPGGIDSDNGNLQDSSGYWWVNNKKTFAHETGGNYIWSPKANQNGARNHTYDNMTRAVVGDLVFAYADGMIKAIGIVSAPAVTAPQPGEFGAAGENWDNEGWRVAVAFSILDNPLRPKEHMETLAPLLPEKYSPIRATGDGNQGIYLAGIPIEMAAELRRLLGGQLDAVEAKARPPAPAQLLIPTDVDESPEAREDRKIFARTDINPTQKQTLVNARRGQGLFRERVIAFEGKCRVTSVDLVDHLRASHIKPWKDSSDYEKLDGNNGLLLAPHVDHLFDHGYISFSDFGDVIVSPTCPLAVCKAWNIDQTINVGPFRLSQRPYLAYHRAHVLKQ